MNKLQNFILTQLQDPDNRKIVNEGQPYFDTDYDEKGENVVILVDGRGGNFEYGDEAGKLFVIRWCINLLPCFDVENPEYATLLERYEKTNQEFENDPIKNHDRRFIIGCNLYNLVNCPETIRQALLTCGAMDLEELEQYAKDNNLIPTI